MWFNNLIAYKYELEESIDWSQCLQEEILKPCPPHARFIYGWLPAFADELVHEVAGATLICMGKEERLLPRSVIQRVVEERVQQIETSQGRAVKRNERSQLMEDIEFELLPKAFCIQKKTMAIVDSKAKQIYINSSSDNQANQLLSLLRKSIPGIQFEPMDFFDKVPQIFTKWICHPETIGQGFSLANDCQLFSLDNEKKKVNCKGYEMPAEEVITLLDKGHAPAEISLNLNDQLQFSVTKDLLIKRIKCLDYLTDEFNELRSLDEEYQQQDAALSLLTGELRALVSSLYAALAPKSSQSPTTSAKEAVAV